MSKAAVNEYAGFLRGHPELQAKTDSANCDSEPELVAPEMLQSKILRFGDIPDIMTMAIEPIDYLVDRLISRNTITLWTGADGTAKTFLAQKMAVAVATGGTFLGRTCQQAPVLYLDYENPSFAVRERLDLLSGSPVPDLKIWGTWLESQPPQIGSELLLTIAKEIRPLIIVDPFRYAHGAEENDSTEMMGVMQCLRYCAAAGGAVIILHHPAKTEGSTGRGSSAIRGAADVALLQELSDDSGLITLKCVKNRFGERYVLSIRPDFEIGAFEVTDSPAFVKRSGELDKLQQIVVKTPGLTQNAFCKEAGMMRARFLHLVRDGKDSLWEERKDGRSFRYFPISLKVQNSDRQANTAIASIPACPVCGAFCLYRDASGISTCERCETTVPGDKPN